MRESKISFEAFGTCFEDFTAERQVSSELNNALAKLAGNTQADFSSWEELSAWFALWTALLLLYSALVFPSPLPKEAGRSERWAAWGSPNSGRSLSEPNKMGRRLHASAHARRAASIQLQRPWNVLKMRLF